MERRVCVVGSGKSPLQQNEGFIVLGSPVL